MFWGVACESITGVFLKISYNKAKKMDVSAKSDLRSVGGNFFGQHMIWMMHDISSIAPLFLCLYIVDLEGC